MENNINICQLIKENIIIENNNTNTSNGGLLGAIRRNPGKTAAVTAGVLGGGYLLHQANKVRKGVKLVDKGLNYIDYLSKPDEPPKESKTSRISSFVNNAKNKVKSFSFRKKETPKPTRFINKTKDFASKNKKKLAIGGGVAAGALGLAVGTKALLNHLRKKKEHV